jgi:uncharacterized protein YceH (UPF0502 family)
LSKKDDIVTDEDKLAECAGDREDRYLHLIMKVRDAAEQAGDQNTVSKLEKLYDDTTDKLETIDKERRQKVVDSQIWALQEEIKVYTEAIEKVKALVE